MITTLYFKDGDFLSIYKLNTLGQQAKSIELIDDGDVLGHAYYEVVFLQPARGPLNYPAYRIIRVDDDGRRGEQFGA
jgi:hypothetical protein